MKFLKMGAIGYGARGNVADIACRPELGSNVIRAADPSPERRKLFLEKHPGAEVFEDFREMLDRGGLDGVFCLAPDYLHGQIALEVLGRGIPLFLEKPMGITVEECDAVLRCAMEHRAKLFVGHNMRYMPFVRKMKEIIDSGMIGGVEAVWCRHFIAYGGDAYFRDWHSERKNTTGLLLQKGAHDIDVIDWLAGGRPVRVSGMGKLSVYNRCGRRGADERGNLPGTGGKWPPLSMRDCSPVMDVEDHNMVMMTLDNGVQACYLQCHYAPDAWRNYTVLGTAGRLENYGDIGEADIRVWNTREDTGRAAPDVNFHLPAANDGYGHGGADIHLVEDFLEYIRSGRRTSVSALAARNAVAAGVAGHLSMRTDGGCREVAPAAPELEAYFGA